MTSLLSLAEKSPERTSEPTPLHPNLARAGAECPVCQKRFNNSSALAKHRLTHSEQRRYICEKCNKAFKRQDHLAGHKLTHEEKKPHRCFIGSCEKSYCDARSLKRHLEGQHHYTCDSPFIHPEKVTDGAYFTYESGMMNNPPPVYGHNGQPYSPITPTSPLKRSASREPISCPLCPKKFRNMAALNGHMRLHGGYSKQALQRAVDNSRRIQEERCDSPSGHSTDILGNMEQSELLQRRSSVSSSCHRDSDCIEPPPRHNIYGNSHHGLYGPAFSASWPGLHTWSSLAFGTQRESSYSPIQHPGVNHMKTSESRQLSVLTCDVKQERCSPLPSPAQLASPSCTVHSPVLTHSPMVPYQLCSPHSHCSDGRLGSVPNTPQNCEQVFFPPQVPQQHKIQQKIEQQQQHVPQSQTSPERRACSRRDTQSSSSGSFFSAGDISLPDLGHDIPEIDEDTRLYDSLDLPPEPATATPQASSATSYMYQRERHFSADLDPFTQPYWSQNSHEKVQKFRAAQGVPSPQPHARLSAVSEEADDEADDVFSTPARNETSNSKKRKPPPINIPRHINSKYGRFTSQLRSPMLGVDCRAPYTPPPLLSPFRPAAGLFSTMKPSTPAHSLRIVSPLYTERVPSSDVRPHINVGADYQALLPSLRDRDDEELVNTPRHADPCVFNPKNISNVSSSELEHLLDVACSAACAGNGMNKELALQLLSLNRGDVLGTVRKLLSGDLRDETRLEETTRWSPEEIAAYTRAMHRNGKNFRNVAQEVCSKTPPQCVEFYYTWKKLQPRSSAAQLPATVAEALGERGERMFRCKVCDKLFQKLKGCVIHQQRQHKAEQPD